MSRKLTWQETVDWVRAQAEQERWRLVALNQLQNWKEFVVAWAGAAPPLKAIFQGEVCPPQFVTFDDRLAWSWDTADEAIDGVLLVIDERSTMGNHDIVQHFNTLRGASLIFADGSMHKNVSDRLEREQTHIDTKASAAVFGASILVAKRQSQFNEMVKKQGGKS